MGGKGRRRREKNYRTAHGGHARLPPPPDPSQVDALPSKLRFIMSFASKGAPKLQTPAEEKRTRDAGAVSHSKHVLEDAIKSEEGGIVKDRNGEEHLVTPQDIDDGDENAHGITEEKKKKKRKRKQVDDLRFELSVDKTSQKRRERRKKYLEAKKKKKQKKSENKEELDFPGREQIKFGDVVQAPPKLVTLPKGLKNVQDASRERIRLQAIEAYRSRKGWTSRPGLKLPSPVTTMPTS